MPVVDISISARGPYADGREFGDVEAYERIDALLTFAVDPDHGANEAIVDLELAERDADGRVRFTADLTVLRPVDESRGNGSLLLELPNRGRRRAVALQELRPGQERHTIQIDDVSALYRIRARLEREAAADPPNGHARD